MYHIHVCRQKLFQRPKFLQRHSKLHLNVEWLQCTTDKSKVFELYSLNVIQTIYELYKNVDLLKVLPTTHTINMNNTYMYILNGGADELLYIRYMWQICEYRTFWSIVSMGMCNFTNHIIIIGNIKGCIIKHCGSTDGTVVVSKLVAQTL